MVNNIIILNIERLLTLISYQEKAVEWINMMKVDSCHILRKFKLLLSHNILNPYPLFHKYKSYDTFNNITNLHENKDCGDRKCRKPA